MVQRPTAVALASYLHFAGDGAAFPPGIGAGPAVGNKRSVTPLSEGTNSYRSAMPSNENQPIPPSSAARNCGVSIHPDPRTEKQPGACQPSNQQYHGCGDGQMWATTSSGYLVSYSMSYPVQPRVRGSFFHRAGIGESDDN